jgi:hypothetical protein
VDNWNYGESPLDAHSVFGGFLPFNRIYGGMPVTKTRKQSGVLKLLTEYRQVLWRKSALEAVPGSKTEALLSCLKQISLTQELAEVLKTDNRLGEKLYRIIRATYLTDKQPGDVDEILDDIAGRYGRVPRRTYFRLKKRAIEIMDAHLH